MSASANNMVLRPAARLTGLKPYRAGRVYGDGGLRLDANEGPSAPVAWLDCLRSLDAQAVRRYPDANALERRIAACLGIAAERVVVTAGGDDAIDRVCRVMLEPGRSLVLHTPTFVMIERGARLAGASVRGVPWMGGQFPLAQFSASIGADTGLVALVSPNNPTGAVIDVCDMERIARAAFEVGALVLVDLAYVEFADADPTPALLGMDNVVMARTFSKAFGLAGMRVGYAVASEEVAGWLRTVGGPYPVSAPGLALAGMALERRMDTDYLSRVRYEREKLVASVRGRGVEAIRSQANFVLMRVDANRLADLGIIVRAFAGELALWSRITLPGDDREFARLMDAVEGVCNG